MYISYLPHRNDLKLAEGTEFNGSQLTEVKCLFEDCTKPFPQKWCFGPGTCCYLFPDGLKVKHGKKCPEKAMFTIPSPKITICRPGHCGTIQVVV
jgi:hypothetical protein